MVGTDNFSSNIDHIPWKNQISVSMPPKNHRVQVMPSQSKRNAQVKESTVFLLTFWRNIVGLRLFPTTITHVLTILNVAQCHSAKIVKECISTPKSRSIIHKWRISIDHYQSIRDKYTHKEVIAHNILTHTHTSSLLSHTVFLLTDPHW